jgi:hypothetical protein
VLYAGPQLSELIKPAEKNFLPTSLVPDPGYPGLESRIPGFVWKAYKKHTENFKRHLSFLSISLFLSFFPFFLPFLFFFAHPGLRPGYPALKNFSPGTGLLAGLQGGFDPSNFNFG